MEGIEWLNVVSVVTWIALEGGAGILAYLFWRELERNSARVDKVVPRLKRYATLVIAVLFAWLALPLLIWLGAYPVPQIPQEWVQALFATAAASVIASQAVHGKLDLRGTDG
jgi:hypothetical protein